MRSNCKKINRTCRFTLSKWFSCFPFGYFQWWGRETEIGCRRLPLLDGSRGAQRRMLQWKGWTLYDSLPRYRPESFSMTVSPTLLIRLLSFNNFKFKVGAIIPIDWEYCSIKFFILYRVLYNENVVFFYRWMYLPMELSSVRLLAGYRQILTFFHEPRWKTELTVS